MNTAIQTNTITHGDCINELQSLPANSVDLLIADPPYNITNESGISFDGTWENDDGGEYKGEWASVSEEWDEMSPRQYRQFTSDWLDAAHHALRPDGSLLLFSTYHHAATVLTQATAFTVCNEIIWYKRDAMPNVTCSRVTASHENIYWLTPNNDAGYYFDYDTAKQFGLGDDRLNEGGKQLRSVWDIPKTKLGVEQDVGHPTQKPLRVLEPLVRIWSQPDDLVCDPFCGSGATAVVSNVNDRQYLGIDTDEEWVRAARGFVETVDEKPQPIRALSE